MNTNNVSAFLATLSKTNRTTFVHQLPQMLNWAEERYPSNQNMAINFAAWHRQAAVLKKRAGKIKKRTARKRLVQSALNREKAGSFPKDIVTFRRQVANYVDTYVTGMVPLLCQILRGEVEGKELHRDDRSMLAASVFVTHSMACQPGRFCDYSALTIDQVNRWCTQSPGDDGIVIVETQKSSASNPIVPWVIDDITRRSIWLYWHYIRPVLVLHNHPCNIWQSGTLASESDLKHVDTLVRLDECAQRLNAVTEDNEIMKGRKHPMWSKFFSQPPDEGWQRTTCWEDLRDAYNMSTYNECFMVDEVGSGGLGQMGVKSFNRFVMEATNGKNAFPRYNSWRSYVATKMRDKDPETVNTMLGHTDYVHRTNYKIAECQAAGLKWLQIYVPLEIDMKEKHNTGTTDTEGDAEGDTEAEAVEAVSDFEDAVVRDDAEGTHTHTHTHTHTTRTPRTHLNFLKESGLFKLTCRRQFKREIIRIWFFEIIRIFFKNKLKNSPGFRTRTQSQREGGRETLRRTHTQRETLRRSKLFPTPRM